MNSALMSVVGLVVTLGLLITVHEFGHFWVARRLGVKVLRFSVGFGKPLWMRRFGPDQTEFVLAALPLGGYVRMLDEREGEVAADERRRAFNTQPVAARIAVVVAGPAANFLFAVLAYALMFSIGVSGLKPMLDQPPPESPAAAAGFRAGDEILSVGGDAVQTWSEAALALLDHGLDQGGAAVLVRDDQEREVERRLSIDGMDDGATGDVLESIGLRPWNPPIPAVIERVREGGAAERSGLQPGDRVLSADAQPIADWHAWAEYVQARPETVIRVLIRRGDHDLPLTVIPERQSTEAGEIGLIGAYAQVPQEMQDAMRVVVRYGPLRALLVGAQRTWDMSLFTLRMLGRMLVGQASLDNLSGPITIAQFAGQTVTAGLTSFLAFLALISVSLGVLNLLPVPILDGGHLLYYLIEAARGSPVSEAVQAAGQRIGLAILLMLMGLAFFNDISRLVGS
jgi:regulator of sigma E protease